MKVSNVSERFASALPYDRYLQTGSEEQQRRWTQVYDLAHLTGAQQQLVGGFERDMKILVYSGIWCGDCVQQGPLIHRIAQGNTAKIDLRFIERPMSDELPEDLRINGGSRVPIVLFFSEDWDWCATAGDAFRVLWYPTQANRRLEWGTQPWLTPTRKSKAVQEEISCASQHFLSHRGLW